MQQVLKRRVFATAVAVVAVLTVIFCSAVPRATAVNVLAIEPLPARSHWYFMRAVLQVLAAGGEHNVTVYTPFASPSVADDVCKNGGSTGCGYVEMPLQLGVPDKLSLDVRTAIADFGEAWRFMSIAVDKSRTACDRIDQMAADGHFSGGRYDLVIVELVSSECMSRVSAALDDVPLVYVFPSPMASWVESKAMGTRPSPSYAARLFASYAAPDTFTRRLENTYGWIIMESLQWFYERDADETRYRKPTMMFVNSDRIVEKSVPISQNMIPVGGVHLSPPQTISSVSHYFHYF